MDDPPTISGIDQHEAPMAWPAISRQSGAVLD